MVAFATRVSTVFGNRPGAPVVSSGRSAVSRSGSREAAASVANGGGLVSLPAVWAPSVSGGGRMVYGVLFAVPM